jgi:hypothetical protein
MRAKILAGVGAALLYGGSAMAQGVEEQEPVIGGEGTAVEQEQFGVPPQDVELEQGEGIGGAWHEGHEGRVRPGQQDRPMMQMGEGPMMLHCYPVPQEAMGGAGLVHPQEDPLAQRRYQERFDNDDRAIGGAGIERDRDRGRRNGPDMRGVTVLLGAGLEGYTGQLAPEINPGPMAAATIGFRPTQVFGFELGYSGAVNNLDADVAGTGPDIVRNGGHAALTMGLAATPVQPYILGGVGLSRYNVRNGGELGYQSDTIGNIPVGAGLRTHIGSFTADARVNYGVLVGNQLRPGLADRTLENGRYMGSLNLGGTF